MKSPVGEGGGVKKFFFKLDLNVKAKIGSKYW